MLAQRFDTPDQVLAHLWSFRRPALSLLGFIHYSLSSRYLCTGMEMQNCPALQEPDLLDFVRNHLLSGQDFRGVLVDVEQFGQHYQHDPDSCEPILQLLGPRPNSPIPLVFHHPLSCDAITVPRLRAVFTFRTLKLRLGKQSAFMMKNRGSSHGFRILNKKITARARAHHKSVTLQSELDGINIVLFIFEERLQANQQSHSIHPEEDDDEDCPDLPELELEDFSGFNPEKSQHLPEATFMFDMGKLPELTATSSRPQQPVPDVAHSDANPRTLNPGNKKLPPFKLKLSVLVQTSRENQHNWSRQRLPKIVTNDHTLRRLQVSAPLGSQTLPIVQPLSPYSLLLSDGWGRSHWLATPESHSILAASI